MNHSSLPDLLLLEQSGEITPEQQAELTDWRRTNPRAVELGQTLEMLSRPLPDPGGPVDPAVLEPILAAGRRACAEGGQPEPPGTVLTPVHGFGAARGGRWLGVAAIAAVLLFGLYMAIRPASTGPDVAKEGGDPVPSAVVQDLPEAPDDVLGSDAIDAFIHEPYAAIASQLGEIDQALFESQMDLSDETAWLAQLN